jgi:ParB family chromosome partitioning protein
MAGGKRVQLGLGALDDLPVLSGATPPVDTGIAPSSPGGGAPDVPPTVADLADIAENPVNQRESFGDIEELAASMHAVGQVQACAAVTSEAFLRLYPDRREAIGDARYVLVTGARRRRAAELNKAPLEIRVNDAWAESRGQFYAACIAENGPRLNFQPWEEAIAIRELVDELGSNKAAAERLGLSPQIVSQRLSIFRLSDPMQKLLRAGELPIEPARTIAANVEAEDQLRAWQEQRWKEARRVPKPSSAGSPTPSRRGRPPRAVRVEWPIGADPRAVAVELAKVLELDAISALADELRTMINDR